MHHVVMGDVVDSSGRAAESVARDLRSVISTLEDRFASHILSPLTVTLGDEFQGVVDSHQTAVAVVSEFLRLRLSNALPFPMRFSLAAGQIDTEINPQVAHGMIGKALTDARKGLIEKDRDRAAVFVTLPDAELSVAMQQSFDIMYRQTEEWVGDDGPYLHDLVATEWDADRIADRHERSKPTVYRRRRTNPVLDYLAARDTLEALAVLADRLEPTWS